MAGNIIYLSHGGGPLPLIGDEGHVEMVECLQAIAEEIPKPKSVLVISAHWEEIVPTVTSGKKPDLIYDYYGFPEESYSIQYPAEGSPELACKIAEMLSDKGIETDMNSDRGFDHGMYVPMKIMYPAADIPTVQLSLMKNLDASKHLKIGKALKELSDEVLIIGSGFSFHNMRAFFEGDNPASDSKNSAFEDWLIETLTGDYTEEERTERLINWEHAPYSRFCHPREEHLIPLHVCYGAALLPAQRHYELNIINKKASIYIW